MGINREFMEVDLEGISVIRYSCRAWISRPAERAGGLISFQGEYRPGSAGVDDALFIRWRIAEFCDVTDPVRIHGLVVDLRELSYQWGEELDTSPRRMRNLQRPVLTVVPPGDMALFEGVIDRRNLRTNLEEAIDEVDRFLNDSLLPPE